MNINAKSDQIDAEDLLKDFKVTNVDNFKYYLKEIWNVQIK